MQARCANVYAFPVTLHHSIGNRARTPKPSVFPFPTSMLMFVKAFKLRKFNTQAAADDWQLLICRTPKDKNYNLIRESLGRP